MTTEQIIEGCVKGDRKAQKALYDTFSSKMFGVCLRYAPDKETARDLLHDGFIKVFAKIGEFRREGSFEGWLRRVFLTTVLGELRKRNSGFVEVDSESALVNTTSSEDSAIDKISAAELLDLMNTLPQGYRTVLNLYAVEGYSHKEIGEMLGISEVTSRSQYARAKAQFCKILEVNGYARV